MVVVVVTVGGGWCGGWWVMWLPPWYNDPAIIPAGPASTNAATTVPDVVVYITLIDGPC